MINHENDDNRAYYFPRAAIRNYHQLGGFKNNRNVLPHTVLEARTSQIKLLAGLDSSEGSEKESVLPYLHFPNFW